MEINNFVKALLILIAAVVAALSATIAGIGEFALAAPATRESFKGWVQRQVPYRTAHRWKNLRQRIASAVLTEARNFDLDPLLLMAVIHAESKFVPTARGRHGEIGLMQLKPRTARWIANRYDIVWRGSKSLFDPATNIRLGAAYLHYLKERYLETQRLYLCAYNMGTRTVDRAIRRNSDLNRYADHVLIRYRTFYQQWGLASTQSGS